MKLKAKIMDEMAMARATRRLAHELLERNGTREDTVIVGIQRRGAVFAEKIRNELIAAGAGKIPIGSIDITFYRDDLSSLSQPVVNKTNIPFDINGKNVVLVDDVLYTGRTVRAAIDCLFRMGRAKTVSLAVMIDRGLRELPIKADFVGKNIPTSHSERVAVEVLECDGRDAVYIYENESEG